MAILKETELVHKILGSICYDNGNGDSKLGVDEGRPYWLARPTGWISNGIEILIAGDSTSPLADSLDRAVKAFNSLAKIEKEGRDLIRPIVIHVPVPDFNVTHYEANLLWIDCQETKTIVVFSWEGFAYKRWDATLSETNSIIELEEKTW